MKLRLSAIACIAALLPLLASSTLAQTAPQPTEKGPQKKIIYFGWDAPDTKYLREHWREIEQLPFDGAAFKIAINRAEPTSGNGSSGNLLGWHVFGPQAFQRKDFQGVIDDLKSVKSAKLKQGLFPQVAIATNEQDQGLNWFDDARWKTIANNWRVLASIVKEGGCKGLLFDPEHYDYAGQGTELFSYQEHRAERIDKSFSEYTTEARQRGREIMQAAGDIFPEMTMFCAYAYDAAWTELQQGKPLEECRYALLPAFLDGMLEGSNARTRWLDAWEPSYGYKERPQFMEAYHTVANRIRVMAADPDLYQSKMRVGFGLWLDNGRHWDTTDFRKNHFSPDEFQRSLQMALDLSDEYVWIYAQEPAFFPRANLPEPYLEAIKNSRKSTK